MILIAAVIAGGATAYYKLKKFAAQPLPITQDTLFKIPPKATRLQLEQLLLRDGMIKQNYKYYLPIFMQTRPYYANFKAGTYRLKPGMTVRSMLTLFNSGKEAQFSIRFVEGKRFRDWYQELAKAPGLKHTLTGKSDEQIASLMELKEGRSLEGWFYPDTYSYTAGSSDVMLLQRANQRMEKMVGEIWDGRADELPYKTPEEMVTMASIIEKETGIDSERSKVASVFVNRLRLGMRLQTDPTVIYGMGDAYKGNITRSDLQKPTPYNTYIISGLPPTPIAMPSKAALEAAAAPADTDYLFFVADGKGQHTFSANLQDHNQAVKQYLQALKEKNEK